MCYVRAYLRASTDEQDATRARDQLKAFAAERGLSIASWYVENESGAKLARPELFRLLADAHPGDVLLVEQVDRLSRLTAGDWERLKAELTARTCPRRRARPADVLDDGDDERRRVHHAHVRSDQRHAARHARRGRPQGLRRSPPSPGAGSSQGQGRGPLQGPCRGRRAQRRASAACSPPASPGAPYRPPRAAAARRSRRSPSASKPLSKHNGCLWPDCTNASSRVASDRSAVGQK